MGIKIPLTMGKFAIVGSKDSDLRSLKWSYCEKRKGEAGYASRTENGKHIYLHKVIANRMGINGMCDHKDRDKLNNRRSNLRSCTPSQNTVNRTRMRNNKSGYKGVFAQLTDSGEISGRWRASIKHSGKVHHLGTFGSTVEAAEAYDKEARRVYGKFACTNF